MPRRPRIVVPGAAHHITQRGNDRHIVFTNAAERRLYLNLLHRESAHRGLRILAWCLMSNHVHLVAVPETPGCMAQVLGQTHSQYALAVNRHWRRVGHLWQGRFFSCVLEGSHLLRAMRYVELNPVRAGLVGMPWEWPWSSASAHIQPGAGDPLLDWPWDDWFRGWDHGGWKDWLIAAVAEADLRVIRRATKVGEPLGSAEFLETLALSIGRKVRVEARGRPKKKGTDAFSAKNASVPFF